MLSNRRFSTPNINISSVINPGGNIKKLEDELKFTDTFANRIKLADAYLAAGQTEKAAELYKSSLTGGIYAADKKAMVDKGRGLYYGEWEAG